ncbi:MAG TPA: DUF542 domain-containing protein [Puia sp.]|uniref:DUF542 domain-containing protein n=1 Tax=Puia sp. TaxID=2045100 RepID=UPI002B9BCBBB|nr:DUF542 domain-containing protein [Puia sp.]HVU94074.1 DUF542 domain-containing protein [Puia sp.]
MNIEQCTVGEIVARDARAAAIFERHQIDFCCNGHRKLAEACGEERVGPVAGELRELLGGGVAWGGALSGRPAMDYGAWPLDLLADFIEKKYHREATGQIPPILGYLEKIAVVHGEAHAELHRIKAIFEESAGELTKHMKREELILFPAIRKMVQTDSVPETFFGPIANPIGAMEQEHETEGERLRTMAQLSDHYTVPADGCTTYRVCYGLMKEFEQALHFHIHLENNLLFPKALAMAEKLGATAR